MADYERQAGLLAPPPAAGSTGKKVAVVGAGPAGLTCAVDVRRQGHKVVIFEAFHKAGGVMVYGIPEFRLPKDLVASEAGVLESMGSSSDELPVAGQAQGPSQEDCGAVFVARIAAQIHEYSRRKLGGRFSANEYLTGQPGETYEVGKAAAPLYPSAG